MSAKRQRTHGGTGASQSASAVSELVHDLLELDAKQPLIEVLDNMPLALLERLCERNDELRQRLCGATADAFGNQFAPLASNRYLPEVWSLRLTREFGISFAPHECRGVTDAENRLVADSLRRAVGDPTTLDQGVLCARLSMLYRGLLRTPTHDGSTGAGAVFGSKHHGYGRPAVDMTGVNVVRPTPGYPTTIYVDNVKLVLLSIVDHWRNNADLADQRPPGAGTMPAPLTEDEFSNRRITLESPPDAYNPLFGNYMVRGMVVRGEQAVFEFSFRVNWRATNQISASLKWMGSSHTLVVRTKHHWLVYNPALYAFDETSNGLAPGGASNYERDMIALIEASHLRAVARIDDEAYNRVSESSDGQTLCCFLAKDTGTYRGPLEDRSAELAIEAKKRLSDAYGTRGYVSGRVPAAVAGKRLTDRMARRINAYGSDVALLPKDWSSYRHYALVVRFEPSDPSDDARRTIQPGVLQLVYDAMPLIGELHAAIHKQTAASNADLRLSVSLGDGLLATDNMLVVPVTPLGVFVAPVDFTTQNIDMRLETVAEIGGGGWSMLTEPFGPAFKGDNSTVRASFYRAPNDDLWLKLFDDYADYKMKATSGAIDAVPYALVLLEPGTRLPAYVARPKTALKFKVRATNAQLYDRYITLVPRDPTTPLEYMARAPTSPGVSTSAFCVAQSSSFYAGEVHHLWVPHAHERTPEESELALPLKKIDWSLAQIEQPDEPQYAIDFPYEMLRRAASSFAE